jgi:hypothetical protein
MKQPPREEIQSHPLRVVVYVSHLCSICELEWREEDGPTTNQAYHLDHPDCVNPPPFAPTGMPDLDAAVVQLMQDGKLRLPGDK